MEYNLIGRSGLRVSNICFGTFTFGLQWDGFGKTNKANSHKILERFASLGGNFIDTANFYSAGVSESIIGEWLMKQKRERFVVATKVRLSMGDGMNDVGLGRKHIMASCEESLRRLQTDYIDLYQIHLWDDAVPPEEWLGTFRDLVTSGRVRHVGVSNLCGWQLQKVVDFCKYEKFPVVISLQWNYKRGVKPEFSTGRIGAVAQDESKAMVIAPAWSQYENNESFWSLLAALQEIAQNHGKTMSQVAIRWLLQKDVVSSVIIGVTSVEQLEDNVGASSNWNLSKEEMENLDTLSAIDMTYPHDMVRPLNTDRVTSFYPYPFVKNKF